MLNQEFFKLKKDEELYLTTIFIRSVFTSRPIRVTNLVTKNTKGSI